MRTRRQKVTIVGAMLFAVVALGTFRPPFLIENAVAPSAPIALGPGSILSDPEYFAFVRIIADLLELVIAEGTALADLGMSRSKNALQTSIRMERFREASPALDGLAGPDAVPN